MNYLKIDNHEIDSFLKDEKKDELFLYAYLLRSNARQPYAITNIPTLILVMGKKDNKDAVKRMRESLKYLINRGYITAYSDHHKETLADVDTVKKSDILFIEVLESESEERYTLVLEEYIDRLAMGNNYVTKKIDLLGYLLLIGRKTERKGDLLQVCYPSLTNLYQNLRVNRTKMNDIIKEMKEKEFVFYDTVKFTFGDSIESRNIYSMWHDKEDVPIAMENIKHLKKFTEEVKVPNIKTADILNELSPSNTYREKVDESIRIRLDAMGFSPTGMGIVKKVLFLQAQFGAMIVVQAIDDLCKRGGMDNQIGFVLSQLDKTVKAIGVAKELQDQANESLSDVDLPEFDEEETMNAFEKSIEARRIADAKRQEEDAIGLNRIFEEMAISG